MVMIDVPRALRYIVALKFRKGDILGKRYVTKKFHYLVASMFEPFENSPKKCA